MDEQLKKKVELARATLTRLQAELAAYSLAIKQTKVQIAEAKALIQEAEKLLEQQRWSVGE
jgi:hypothetical protein